MEKNNEIKSKKALITELISSLHPESDLSDEETLFGHIYDDYEAYATVLEVREAELAEAEAKGELRGRNARIEEMLEREAPTDGVPDLSGTNTLYHTGALSIFDIARGGN